MPQSLHEIEPPPDPGRFSTDCTDWALDLPHTAARLDLTGIEMRTTCPTAAFDTLMGRFWRLTLEQLAPEIEKLPTIRPGDTANVVVLLSRPGLVELGMATITVTATRPSN
ncbi:hypothetical protein [Streptomyces sp. CB01580]|uniref:hypothetical protein n=1 Tax=Streptomyces sp. CB01580 TaxID=1703933 RepID=UPI0011613CF2|nr:hypothetical protein [Streptomyces sp. CB01580]